MGSPKFKEHFILLGSLADHLCQEAFRIGENMIAVNFHPISVLPSR